MADQKSKKIDENNVEDSKEDDSEMEQSAASQDETSDTTKPSDSPNKDKKPAKGTRNKKEDKKKEEESEQESSDDEELVGSLDAPLVVEGKRVRKSTEFLSNLITTPQSKERRKTDIPEGKGEKLGSMPRVQFQLSRIPGEELKPLHRILFGRPGTASEVKKHIKQFNGFNIEKGSKEYQVKKEQVDRFTQDSMKRLCEILDVEKKGSKEDVLERVMDFLLCPKASGKEVPVKKSSKNKKTKNKKTESKVKKAKPKKAKSDETVESDKDSDEEKVDEPPKKKVKSSTKEKKETKKPAKKEKKVVSIKISPGKKAKKTKEKKTEPGDSSDDEPLSKKAKKSPPSNDEIVELVKELLDGADLEKITMKSVCKQVYERYPAFDLTDRKEFIKESVKEIIT